MKDVAKLAGVSIATVSATISGRLYVSPELQERVRDAIAKLNYRHNVVASALKRGRTSLIGLIVPDITNPFYTQFIADFQNFARADGLSVILGISGQDPAREIELIEYMAGQHAEALVIGTCAYGGQSAEALRAVSGQMNLVLVDSIPPDVVGDRVEADNFLAGKIAAEHIISFGHKRIAVVTGPVGAKSSDERVKGYQNALESAGIPVLENMRRDGGFRTEQAYEVARDLLDQKVQPTAIFVCNNLMLIGVMRAISERHLHVPEDISLVNVDDFPWASAFRPALTTVQQPVTEMALAAYESARDRMKGFTGGSVDKLLKPTLMERASCMAPKGVLTK